MRLEVSLFSGYELHSVNPVVLDGASFADLHYGSRGESIWFVFANVSTATTIIFLSHLNNKPVVLHENEIICFVIVVPYIFVSLFTDQLNVSSLRDIPSSIPLCHHQPAPSFRKDLPFDQTRPCCRNILPCNSWKPIT